MICSVVCHFFDFLAIRLKSVNCSPYYSALVCKETVFWARAPARKKKQVREKERARSKAKMEKIRRASTKETMRLRKKSRRMARMVTRMRAKLEALDNSVVVEAC